MIRVTVEVSGGVRCRATVQAESILQALSLASNRYPGSSVKVIFPIEPEVFFVGEQCLLARETERPGKSRSL